MQHKNLEYCLLKKRIKKNEGFSLKPYKDQLGFTTIGFGHLILPKEQHLIKKSISKSLALPDTQKEFDKI